MNASHNHNNNNNHTHNMMMTLDIELNNAWLVLGGEEEYNT